MIIQRDEILCIDFDSSWGSPCDGPFDGGADEEDARVKYTPNKDAQYDLLVICEV